MMILFSLDPEDLAVVHEDAGAKIIVCACGTERWYGYGACSECGCYIHDERAEP